MEQEITTDSITSSTIINQCEKNQHSDEKRKISHIVSLIKNPIVLAGLVWIMLCILFIISYIRP